MFTSKDGSGSPTGRSAGQIPARTTGPSRGTPLDEPG